MRLEGKIALITGGASGFGREAARRFAEEGASVAIADLNEQLGKQSLAELEAAGKRPGLFIAGDIATAAGAQQAVGRTIERFGRIDVLVNNAGIADNMGTQTWNVEEETWDRIQRINLKSVYLCSRVAIADMLKRKAPGAIVNTASIAASSPVGGAAYAASKGGMLSYTRLVARELAPHGIRLNCVSPGFMRTPMSLGEARGTSKQEQEQRMAMFAQRTPMGRPGTPLDIADAMLYLASDEARFVTGQELVVDGGFLVRS
jgi:NAD(P)-dependent dehydrogenase (short-subunit alcohol dehydrogenase family)